MVLHSNNKVRIRMENGGIDSAVFATEKSKLCRVKTKRCKGTSRRQTALRHTIVLHITSDNEENRFFFTVGFQNGGCVKATANQILCTCHAKGISSRKGLADSIFTSKTMGQ